MSEQTIPRRGVVTGPFRRDLRRAARRGKDMSKLLAVILSLVTSKPLPSRHKDHRLKGRWSGCRDAHIEPDWLLIYQIAGSELRLERTGSHTDLFDD